MNLLKRLFSFLSPNITIGVPSPNQVPPPAPPKDRTSEPSCLARGIAKAWIDDRANWVILRSVPSDSGQLVTLTHESLDITITFIESALGSIHNLDCRVSDRQMIYEIKWNIYYMYDTKQIQVDYGLLRDTILKHPYPELATFLADQQIRLDRSNAREAARAAKLEAIEALGCAEDKV